MGEFLLSIYLSLFNNRSAQIGSTLEALVAKDVRKALGMFGDILVSPHIPADHLTGVALGSGQNMLPEFRIIRALMRGRYRYYNGKSQYIRNVLEPDSELVRPNNFITADILEYLIRNRKSKIDFNQEGYATIERIQHKMAQLGHDENDCLVTISRLCEWGLLEAESLISSELTPEEPIRVHASGFIHMRFLLQREEYLVGITTNTRFASKATTDEIASVWTGQARYNDLSLSSKKRILRSLLEYSRYEYERRCKRHPFYQDEGYGGRQVVSSIEKALDHLEAIKFSNRRRTEKLL